MKPTHTHAACVLICLQLASCSLIDGFFSEESSAETQRKSHLNEPPISFNYPSNWTLTHDQLKPEELASYTLTTPGKCSLRILVHTLQNASEQDTERFLYKHNPRPRFSPNPTHRFTRWGSFTGTGRVLQGTLLGKETTLRLFTHTRNHKSFMIFEECWNTHRPKAKPGFQLVERTFSINPIDLSKFKMIKPRTLSTPSLRPKPTRQTP